jgi:hypothetical protein
MFLAALSSRIISQVPKTCASELIYNELRNCIHARQSRYTITEIAKRNYLATAREKGKFVRKEAEFRDFVKGTSLTLQ